VSEVKKGAEHVDLQKVQAELMGRKQELEQELTTLYQDKFSDDQVQDVGDQTLTSVMESLKSSFHDTKLEEYNRILKALEMIQAGTYGICADCHLPILEKRLKSFPNATRCLACQENFESTHANEI